jgi:hypothetical protein
MFQLGKVLRFATILEQIGFTTRSPTQYCLFDDCVLG